MKVTTEDQLVVQSGDILVGVPCYKDGPMVDRCLRSLAEPGVQLLLVDNGSDPDVKQAISGKGLVIRNDVNRYVNPAWNQIMEVFLEQSTYDLLVIANSDLVLDPGWAATLRAHRTLHSCDQIIFGVDAPRQRRSAGSFFALTRSAVLASCPIPDDLLVMGGDDFIFHVNLGVGHEEHVVSALTMSHIERGTYDKSPEIWGIARGHATLEPLRSPRVGLAPDPEVHRLRDRPGTPRASPRCLRRAPRHLPHLRSRHLLRSLRDRICERPRV